MRRDQREDVVDVHVVVGRDVHRMVKVLAAEQGRPVWAVYEDAVRGYVMGLGRLKDGRFEC